MCVTIKDTWRRGTLVAASTLGLLFITHPPLAAHETEQFTVPPDGQRLADISPFIENYFIGRLEFSVAKINRGIKQALAAEGIVHLPRTQSVQQSRRLRAIGQQPIPSAITRLHQPEAIANAYRYSFFAGPVLIEQTEAKIRKNKPLQTQNPGMLLLYKPVASATVTHGTDVMPVSNFARMWQGATVSAYGIEFGLDKIGHFIHFGYSMYIAYRQNLRFDISRQDAMRRAVQAQVNSLTGENGFYGNLVVGAYSNADLASNYVGCLFFRNLTEPVKLKGQMRPAMLLRNGPFWEVAAHVQDDPKFFRWFVSDHFNEALNPSLYRKEMRTRLRENVRQRLPDFLAYYCDVGGRSRTQDYFKALLTELTHYYGLDYGHRGSYDELVSISSEWSALP